MFNKKSLIACAVIIFIIFFLMLYKFPDTAKTHKYNYSEFVEEMYTSVANTTFDDIGVYSFVLEGRDDFLHNMEDVLEYPMLIPVDSFDLVSLSNGRTKYIATCKYPLKEKYEYFLQKTKPINEQCLKESDNVQKLKLIYKFVTSSISYKETGYYNDMIYALNEGYGTCGAFAGLFSYLADCNGFENRLIVTSDKNHVYNAVTLNGVEYYFDATWDYGQNENDFLYFMMTKERNIERFDNVSKKY